MHASEPIGIRSSLSGSDGSGTGRPRVAQRPVVPTVHLILYLSHMRCCFTLWSNSHRNLTCLSSALCRRPVLAALALGRAPRAGQQASPVLLNTHSLLRLTVLLLPLAVAAQVGLQCRCQRIIIRGSVKWSV